MHAPRICAPSGGCGEGCARAWFVSPNRSARRLRAGILRLRDSSGHDPFWGLVRVEIAVLLRGTRDLSPSERTRAPGGLAEALPLSVPARDLVYKMVYGIRDCEEYLRAVR